MGEKRVRRNWFAALGVFVAVFVFAFLVQKFNNGEEASAANYGAFDAGYIISDYQMTDYTSMSEAAIQNFLKSKENCNDRDLGKYTYGEKVGYFSESLPYTWHVADGHFVCLADENINGESAAHIIWQAAQDYKINPKVLIATLQKEQWIVDDSFPHSVQYKSAMGYACPDTAPCAPEYAGFKNQVRGAASLFREVMSGGWSNYPVGANYVQYSPNAACGGSVVNIRNKATSALYRYTPYQPNAAALSVRMGVEVPCGAYGNKNFYGIFEDWFGNIKWDGYQDVSKVRASISNITNPGTDVALEYRTHLEHYGWMDWTAGAKAAGSVGFSLRMESLQLKLKNTTGIEYRAHVEDVGWMDYVKDGAATGTIGQSRRMEAVQIRLTGEIARRYDVYYRTHVEDKGWTAWVKNDEVSGTVGEAKRIEAIQIRIVKKDLGLGPEYQTHVQNVDWQKWVENAKTAGTTGRSLRVEAIRIKLPSELADVGDISYKVHVQDIGWQGWVKNGETAGTTGRSLRVEAVQIKLSDELAAKYDVYYRTHVQDIGWQGWVKNGETAGTTGRSLRVEALQIELVAK